MMRTDHDLRGAFALLEQRADAYGTPEFLIGRGARRHRWTRQWWASTALASTVTGAVVAGAAFAAVTIGSHRSTVPGGPPSFGPLPKPVALQYTFRIDPLPGARVWMDGVNPDYQAADVAWNGAGADLAEADLRVYAPHVYDPSGVTERGGRVKVDGHDGYFDTSPRDPNNPHQPMPVLAWQYGHGHDSWATIQFHATDRSPDQLRQFAVRLADAVRTGVQSTLRLPFRIGYLPPGLVPQAAAETQSRPGFGGVIGLGDRVPASDPDIGRSALNIDVIPKPPHQRFCAPGTARTPVQGSKGCFRWLDGGKAGREFDFETKDLWVSVDIDGAHLSLYPDDVLVKIARSLRFAPLTDYGALFDARTVLPY
jgi:hypothetical protein